MPLVSQRGVAAPPRPHSRLRSSPQSAVRRGPKLTRPTLIVFVSITLLLADRSHALADLVRRCDFLTLLRSSGTILHGRCTARREVTPDSGLPFTEYTFDVIDATRGCRNERGELLKSVTFRHVGTTQGRRRPDGTVVAPLRLGLPRYKVGDELVLFLTRESSLKLCAPVGLKQGVFRVDRKKDGTTIVNPHATKLFERVAPEKLSARGRTALTAALAESQSIELKTFLTLCREVKE